MTVDTPLASSVAKHGLRAELVQGSPWLTYEHMFTGSDPDGWLFRTPDFRVGENGPVQSGRHIDELVRRVPRRAGSTRMLLVGEPDIGKTTIAYALMCRLTQWPPPASIGPALPSPHRVGRARSHSNSVPRAGRRPAMVVPLARHLREYQEWPHYFGTRLWMRSCGPTARVPARGPEPLLILDSLDDLARHKITSVEALLDRDLFTQAAVITCSRALFDEIKVTDLVHDADVIVLEGLGVAQRLDFARSYMSLASRTGAGRASEAEEGQLLAHDVEAAVRRDAAGGNTFREPLHLLIQLETLRTGVGPRGPQLDFYVTSTLEQEVAAGARKLPLVQICDLLAELATLLNPFAAGPLPVSPAVTDFLSASSHAEFVRGAAERLSLTHAEVLNELAHCRFTRMGPRGLGMPANQFRDYFFARGIMRRLLTEGAPERVDDQFSNLFPGPVVGLLMDELRCVQRSEWHRARVLQRLWAALDEASRELGLMQTPLRAPTQVEVVSHRVLCQQIGFYLAVAIGAGGHGERLRQEVATKTALRDDAWIHRGVIVGLGLGGKERVIAQYVEDLWEERRAHDRLCGAGGPCEPGARRQVNVEFNLVLFRDAAPLEGNPDRCAPPTECARTITGMLDLLETEPNLELCRLVLFIILDLHEYHWGGDPSMNLGKQWRAELSPPRSGVPTSLSTIAEQRISWTSRDRLTDVLARFRSEQWEEIPALHQLLVDIPAGAGVPPVPVAEAVGEGETC